MRKAKLAWMFACALSGALACGSPREPVSETGDGDSGSDSDGDSDSESNSNGDGDSDDGDGGDKDGDCYEGQWAVAAQPGECLAIDSALLPVGPPPAYDFFYEDFGQIAVDVAGNVHIVTQRVHVAGFDPSDPNSGDLVDIRTLHRSNESGEWAETVVTNTAYGPVALGVTPAGDVTVILQEAIAVRIDGVWSQARFDELGLPPGRPLGFDPASNAMYLGMLLGTGDDFVLGGTPSCLLRILEVAPEGCEPEFRVIAGDVGAPGTLELIAEGPEMVGQFVFELAHLHYEAGELEQSSLGLHDENYAYRNLAADANGTLHTFNRNRYEYGQDAQSWTVVELEDPSIDALEAPTSCRIAATDAGDVWLTWLGYSPNLDDDPAYSAHVVDGAVALELMGAVSDESPGRSRSIAIGPDGEPHVLAYTGGGHRYFFREAGAWTSIDFGP